MRYTCGRRRKSRKVKVFAGIIIILLLVLVYVVANIPGTYLWFNTAQETPNAFDIAYPGIAVEEQFVPPQKWPPGMEVTKTVQFRNTGKLPVYLRVSYMEMWQAAGGGILSLSYEPQDAPGTLVHAVGKNWTSTWPQYTGSQAPSPAWVDGQDGYFYYSYILAPDEATAPVLSSLVLRDDAPDTYADASYTLEFRAAAVAASMPPADVYAYWGLQPAPQTNGRVYW